MKKRLYINSMVSFEVFILVWLELTVAQLTMWISWQHIKLIAWYISNTYILNYCRARRINFEMEKAYLKILRCHLFDLLNVVESGVSAFQSENGRWYGEALGGVYIM